MPLFRVAWTDNAVGNYGLHKSSWKKALFSLLIILQDVNDIFEEQD